ncbi:MAG: HpcH/HpaI aldolase family protein [Thermogutta sp.]
MRKNTIKTAIQQGKIVWGTWVTIGEERVIWAIAEAGFDWITIDMEHTPLDWSQVDRLVGFALAAGITPLVRITVGDTAHIKRALDLGASGLVVPMVESVEQAREIISASRYPPQGSRSAAAAHHHRRFQMTLAEYLSAANDEIAIVLQIESPMGVEQASEIAELPGCDALLIGPLDLACRLFGPTLQLTSDQEEIFRASVETVIAAGKKSGCATGFHARSVEEAIHWANQGMQLLAVSNDLNFLTSSARTTISQLRSALPPRNL